MKLKKERDDWWIPNFDPYVERHEKRNAIRHEEAMARQFSVKLCPDCNRVYDPPLNHGGPSGRTHNEYYLTD